MRKPTQPFTCRSQRRPNDLVTRSTLLHNREPTRTTELDQGKVACRFWYQHKLIAFSLHDTKTLFALFERDPFRVTGHLLDIITESSKDLSDALRWQIAE